MADSARERRTSLDDAVQKVESWLEKTCTNIRRLLAAELTSYRKHRFYTGWEIEVDFEGRLVRLHVLLDKKFPFSTPRVASASENHYLEWPHFEENGITCLPKREIAWTDAVAKVNVALEDACDIIARYLIKPDNEELKREFISYWGFGCNNADLPVWSLLRADGETRNIAVWSGKKFILVGENQEQIEGWLKNRNFQDRVNTSAGVFVSLPDPWIPPFPETLGHVNELLKTVSLDVVEALEQQTLTNPTNMAAVVVMSARAESSVGLTAITVQNGIPKKINGFRELDKVPSQVKLAYLRGAKINRRVVARADPAWVHGRDRNPLQATLYNKTVAIFGCGSLGSHVAIRLAQAGIGGLILVDPQNLVTANVGRHALGMEAVGVAKSDSLSNLIRQRFPHMRVVEAYPYGWQNLPQEAIEKVWSVDLIVSAIGDWADEGSLNELHHQQGKPPIIYGWMEEQAAAAHAVGILSSNSCLQCLLDTTGKVLLPETVWENSPEEIAEPACGTIFQPYGPLDLSYAETLVAELCIDVLAGKVTENCHHVHATSTERLNELKGSWSESHLLIRPKDFSGSFQFERPMHRLKDCPICHT